MFFSGFKGGIHPCDHKNLTKDEPIKELAVPSRLTFLMSQGGRGTTPSVQKGDKVKKGQIIGQSEEFFSSPIHSSVSGEVESIERVLNQRGEYETAVIIKNDYREDEIFLNEKKENGYVSGKQLAEIVKKAGIVGMGGAGFPSHVKLLTDKKIDAIIVNAAECEPYLTNDYRILKEKSGHLAEGLDIVLHALGVMKGYIALEDNKKDVVFKMRENLKAGMKVKILKTKYPQGSEKHLIRAVTGRVVPEGKLPSDVGVVVLNASTILAIYEAVREGKTVTQRIVTLSGGAIKNPSNFMIRIGTSFKEAFEGAGGFIKEPRKIIVGGPMMGMSQYSLDVPVTKTTSGLLALTKDELLGKEETPCLRCGKCVEACPMGLVPLRLSKLVKEKNYEDAKKEGLLSCIECGSCAYTCPSDRNPVAIIRSGKKALREGK